MMNKYKYLIIDGSNLYHRCYALGSIHSNKTKGVIKECLDSIDRLVSEYAYDDSEVYFLFDNTQSQINIRKEIDSGYKSNREKKANDNLYKYHSILIEILKIRDDRYRVLMAGSLEADDLVKPLLKILKVDLLKKAIMVSNDLDWTRNLTDVVHWYNWVQVYDRDAFFSQYKFNPSEEGLKIYKAIKGDPSDHIHCAIHSFPTDILEKICNDASSFRSFEDFLNYCKSLSEDIQQKIRLHMKDLKRNYMLVDFAPVEKPIEDYIRVSSLQKVHLRLMLQSIDLPVPDHLKNKEEIANDFFA